MNTIEIPTDAEVEYGMSGPIWLDKSGIIIAINKGEKEHTLEHAKDVLVILDKVSQKIPRPLMVDFTMIKHLSREAREHYTNEENSAKTKAVGIITRSNVGRMVANFFIGMSKSNNPVRIFNSPEEALQWLKQYI